MMTESERTIAGPKIGGGIVAPINRVNLALPFSKITIQEPSKQLAALGAIVRELLSVLESGASVEAISALRERAEILTARSS